MPAIKSVSCRAKALYQFQEASAKLPEICYMEGQSVVPDKSTATGPDIKAKTDPPAWTFLFLPR